MSATVPRECINTTLQPASAHTRDISGSRDIADTSFTMATSADKKLPPSLKLSGVTLRIPKMVGRCDFDGQANVTPGLPPVLRRAAASTSWDARPVSPALAPTAAG